MAESGNGAHLLYPLDLPNDDASRELVKGTLAGLAQRFDDVTVQVDQVVFNAARICKLYGTTSNKGDHSPFAPHRLSRLKSVPDRECVVTVDQLRAEHPKAQDTIAARSLVVDPARHGERFDLDAFIEKLGISAECDRHDGRDRYRLHQCPFNADHGRGEAAIFRSADGALGFKCQHASCADKHWQDVRELVDGPREVRRASTSAVHGLSGMGGAGHTLAAGQARLGEVVLTRGSDIAPEPINWLWRNYLAVGKLHLLGGQPGTGKTQIAQALGAAITKGARWPDGTQSQIGSVVMWSSEDDPKDTLVPRFHAAGADTSKVYFVSGIRTNQEDRSFDPALDMDALRRALTGISDVRLLIVDPIVSAVAGDSHKNSEVRRDLQPLVDMAAALGCAVLGITHFTKGTGGRDPVERITGSLAFGALARVVMVAAKNQQEEGDGRTRRIFTIGKSNIGPDGGGFEYEIQQCELRAAPGVEASSVTWGEALKGSARELLAVADAIAGGGGGGGGRLAEAVAFLEDALAHGQVPGKGIEADAKEAGISKATLRRAKDKLDVRFRKDGMDGGWLWWLPERRCSEESEDAHKKSVSTFDTFGGHEHLPAYIAAESGGLTDG
jgi:hypothetical protein